MTPSPSASSLFPGPASGHRQILLADADAFFVAVARRVDPTGAGRAPFLLVGGSPAGRGVVTSASYETRAFGVRSGMPTARALRLCPQAVCVPVPRAACVEHSRAIRSVLQRFAPIVEPASIDEVYLDLTGTEGIYGEEPLEQTAARIREAVGRETGLSVSIGGGTSKLIAKLAAKQAKPGRKAGGRGVFVVAAGEEIAFLEALEVSDIPMIGPRFQQRLRHLGLVSVRDVLGHDLATLEAWLGEREGRWLFERVRGVDPTPVMPPGLPRSLSREETFATDLTADADLERELLHLVVDTSSDLRSRRLGARTVTVKLRDADFTTRRASHTVAAPVAAERPIHETARALLRRLRRARRTGVRLLGVALSGLVPAARMSRADQLDLFEAPTDLLETDRDRAVSGAVDEITGRFGRSSIVRGPHVPKRRRPS